MYSPTIDPSFKDPEEVSLFTFPKLDMFKKKMKSSVDEVFKMFYVLQPLLIFFP